MIGEFRIRFNQVLETWKTAGFRSVVSKTFLLNKEIVIAEKDLASLKGFTISAGKGDVEFIEINGNPGEERFFYGLKSRRLKRVRNLDRRYRGFGLIRDNEVIGDVWYFDRTGSSGGKNHPDVKRLGIPLADNEVYLFDMYVKPEERGGGLVNFMMWNALRALKERGFVKAYGYYVTGNVPALWVHRTLGYREVSKLKWRKSYFLRSWGWPGNGY